MKITVCDICKTQDNKITESIVRAKFRGKSYLNLDLCEEHRNTPPKNVKEYEKFVNKLMFGGLI